MASRLDLEKLSAAQRQLDEVDDAIGAAISRVESELAKLVSIRVETRDDMREIAWGKKDREWKLMVRRVGDSDDGWHPLGSSPRKDRAEVMASGLIHRLFSAALALLESEIEARKDALEKAADLAKLFPEVHDGV